MNKPAYKITMTMMIDGEITAAELQGTIGNKDFGHIVNNLATDIQVVRDEEPTAAITCPNCGEGELALRCDAYYFQDITAVRKDKDGDVVFNLGKDWTQEFDDEDIVCNHCDHEYSRRELERAIKAAEDRPRSECGNCAEVWADDELVEIEDLDKRMSPGDIHPSGQCPDPDCGALCTPTNHPITASMEDDDE